MKLREHSYFALSGHQGIPCEHQEPNNKDKFNNVHGFGPPNGHPFMSGGSRISHLGAPTSDTGSYQCTRPNIPPTKTFWAKAICYGCRFIHMYI